MPLRAVGARAVVTGRVDVRKPLLEQGPVGVVETGSLGSSPEAIRPVKRRGWALHPWDFAWKNGQPGPAGSDRVRIALKQRVRAG